MTRARVRTLLAATLAILSGCAPHAGQNTYNENEVGLSRHTEFGTVLNVREVKINGKNSDTGTLLGAGVGAGGGSYVGNGSGNAWATAGAAVVGAVAGHYAEQAISDRNGYEYVVNLQSGDTVTIVQEQVEGDRVFKPGNKVMLQYCDRGKDGKQCTEGGRYQRLLPVAKLPPYNPHHSKKLRAPKPSDIDAENNDK